MQLLLTQTCEIASVLRFYVSTFSGKNLLEFSVIYKGEEFNNQYQIILLGILHGPVLAGRAEDNLSKDYNS